MKRSLSLICLTVAAFAAVVLGGCGGGSSSSTTAPPAAGGTGGGPAKKATAPNAPAGSRVVSCKVGAGAAGGLRATAVDCGSARALMRRWEGAGDCALGAGDSRGSCSLEGFRCQAVRTGQGTTVSCARPGGDVTFEARAR